MNSDFEIINGELVQYHGTADEIIIPENVTAIKNGAFYQNASLKSVIIPKNVLRVENLPFQLCSNLESITVSEDNPNYASVRGVLYDKNLKTLLRCPQALKDVIIPESVTDIGKWAFYFCNLETLKFPESVTDIRYGAFYCCFSLTEITLPDRVQNAENSAFKYCNKLNITYQGLTFSGSTFEKISLKSIMEIIRNGELSDKMPPELKYIFLLKRFSDNPQDETNLVPIRKNFQRIFRFLTDRNEIETIQKLLKYSDFVSHKNIDKFIQYAIDTQKQQIQIMLTDYKYKNNWYQNADKKLKL